MLAEVEGDLEFRVVDGDNECQCGPETSSELGVVVHPTDLPCVNCPLGQKVHQCLEQLPPERTQMEKQIQAGSWTIGDTAMHPSSAATGGGGAIGSCQPLKGLPQLQGAAWPEVSSLPRAANVQ